jgi:hypothetical protein
MRSLFVALAAIAFLAFSGAVAAAQQGPKPTKKPPVQTPDNGVDDGTQNPGQGKKDIGDKDVASVTVTTHPSGAAVAELDESFEEAIIVTVKPDGTRTISTQRGLAARPSPVPAAPAVEPPALEEK